MMSWILSMSKVNAIPLRVLALFFSKERGGMEGVCKFDLVDRLWLGMVPGCGDKHWGPWKITRLDSTLLDRTAYLCFVDRCMNTSLVRVARCPLPQGKQTLARFPRMHSVKLSTRSSLSSTVSSRWNHHRHHQRSSDGSRFHLVHCAYKIRPLSGGRTATHATQRAQWPCSLDYVWFGVCSCHAPWGFRLCVQLP